MSTIRGWSYSRLSDFEKCRHMAKLKYIDRIPEPERELRPGQTEHANDRGSRIHEEIEQYTRGLTDAFPNEARHFRGEVDRLRAGFAAGVATFEGEWGMDRGWDPAEWRTAWLRLKLDALMHISSVEAVAIDYKTGKKFGNEIKHGEQLQLYALCTFLRHPMLEIVHTELWYLDLDDMTQRTMTRDQALRFKRSFDARGDKVTSCTDFPPNPSKFTCRWCPFLNTEHCSVGVSS